MRHLLNEIFVIKPDWENKGEDISFPSSEMKWLFGLIQRNDIASVAKFPTLLWSRNQTCSEIEIYDDDKFI